MKRILGAVGVLIVFAATLIAIPLLLSKASEGNQEITIIAANFPAYDFARAVTKDVPGTEVKMLISPGAEVHSYEPTPGDIKNIKESDLFIYTGGESDTWAENLLGDLKSTKVIKMLEQVAALEEETTEGMETEEEEEEGAYDEHVWTSLKNANKIIIKIKDELVALDPKNRERYEQNATAYTDKIATLEQEISATIKNASRKEIIFGDRFPLRYFANDYSLTYYAAFPGCSDQTEASAKTIAFLVDKIKSDHIPVVFKIELSSGNIAETIAKETGATILEFHSAHNVSKADFERGLTYLQIMENNLTSLKKALE